MADLPKVYNKKRGYPIDAVYVGRPSTYGNPFTHWPVEMTSAEFQVATAAESIDKYEEYLMSNPELLAAVKRDLRGKNLVCWCAPARCHADILILVANSDD